MTIIDLRIESVGEKYVVVGDFNNRMETFRREFDFYGEALQELAKMALREETRYESYLGRRIGG